MIQGLGNSRILVIASEAKQSLGIIEFIYGILNSSLEILNLFLGILDFSVGILEFILRNSRILLALVGQVPLLFIRAAP